MMNRVLGTLAALVLALVILPSNALAQGTLAGDWDVIVVATGQTIPIVLHITEGDDGYGGTFDAPSQGGIDRPITSITVDNPEFRLEFETGGPPVVFEGKHDGDKLIGTFSQGTAKGTFEGNRRAETEPDSAEGDGSR
jgi:hypothetical protein